MGDGVFSAGVLGEGLAIVPDDDILYAPASGTVSLIMDESKHALALTLNNGVELFLHVGIDTVNMKGEGFEYFVEKGEAVSTGTKLLKFDREKIKAAGYPDFVVCVITNPNGKKLNIFTGKKSKANETEIIEFS